MQNENQMQSEPLLRYCWSGDQQRRRRPTMAECDKQGGVSAGFCYIVICIHHIFYPNEKTQLHPPYLPDHDQRLRTTIYGKAYQ